MNAVDVLIKDMLIGYPSLFKNRLDGLVQLFTTSNYMWQNGRLVHCYGVSVQEMDFSDLDENAVKINDAIESIDGNTDPLYDLYQHRKYAHELQYMERLHRLKNIDVVAKTTISSDALTYLDMLHMSLRTLSDAPFGSIDGEFLAAAEEFIRIIRYSLRSLFGGLGDEIPEGFQKLEKEVVDISEKLEAQSGSNARAKNLMKLLLTA